MILKPEGSYVQKTPSQIISKTFLKLLPIQIILVTIGSINSIIDSTMATNLLGSTALAATGLIFPLTRVLMTISVTFIGGAQILCGQFLGKDQVNRCSAVFTLDMLSMGVLGGIFTLICLCFPDWMGSLLVKDAPELVEGTIRYMQGWAIGIIPMLLTSHLPAFLQLERQEKRTYIGMAVMIATNSICDYVFVAVLPWGLFGLGLATTIGNLVFTVIMAAHYFTGKASIKLDMRSVAGRDLGDIVRIGAPGATTQLAQLVRASALNALMLRIGGENAMAAFSAVNSFGSVAYAATAGVASATLLLFSVYVGEEDRTGLEEIMRTAFTKGLGIVILGAVTLSALATPLTYLFYRPDAGIVYEMTRAGFVLFPPVMILSCSFLILNNYYQCRERMAVVNLMSVFDGVIGILVFAYLLAPKFGMTGVWVAHLLNGLPPILIAIGYVWMKLGHCPRRLSDFLLLTEDFGIPEDKRMDLSIHSMEEVINLSRKVADFCSRHDIDSRRTMFASLAVEEMAGNIVDHGFRDGKKHTIDVRILLKNDDLMIRFKDDGRTFNPKERQALINPEDITHNIGLRLIAGIARDMRYQNSLGLNVLTIVI